MSKQCLFCGASIDDNALFCDECGKKQDPALAKLEAEREELNKKYREAVNSLQKSFHTMEMMEPPKPKRGRPKKAETYASEVDDLREDFGIKDVARELANMKED